MLQPDHPLFVCLVVFAATSIGVWMAGARLVRYIDAIADRTNIGQAAPLSPTAGGAHPL